MLSEVWPIAVPLWKRDGSVGAYALVDADDHEAVMRHRWYAMPQRGQLRAARMQGRRTILLHRELLGLHPGDPQVDHKNADALDNRRANLRIATQHQNAQNRRGANRNSRSGIRGVSPRPDGKWRAAVWSGGKMLDLGHFDSIAEAEAVVVAFRRAHMPTSEMDQRKENG